jgi:hypothetical protein
MAHETGMIGFRRLRVIGLGVALVWGVAGCHKDAAQSTAAPVDQDAGDPADANMAPGNSSGGYGPAQPAQVLGQSDQYQGQQQGQDYAPQQQQAAPVVRQAPGGGYQSPAPYSGDQGYDNSDQAADQYAADLTDEAATEPPPPLPDYEQPPAPDPDYLWTPGYWGWGDGGYYWVPGYWVAAPYAGALWTPGYWGFYGGRYRFHHGFWGLHIGYYGGIDYGYGYTGYGYYGGYWNHDHFFYNTAVNRVNENAIHNVYRHNVVVDNRTMNGGSVNRVSFNGGRGGVQAQPRAAEIAVLHEQRNAPMAAQVQVQREAAQNKGQFYSANKGRPAVAVNARPVSADRTPPAALPRVSGPIAQPAARGEVRPGQGQPQVQGRPGQAQPETRGLQPQQQNQRGAAQPETRGLQPQQGRPEQAQPQTRGLQPQQSRPEQAQPQTRGLQPQQSRPEQAQPQTRGLQPQQGIQRGPAQPETRGLQPQSQPNQARPTQAQPETRGLQPQRQAQPEQRQAQPQPQMRQAPPQQQQRQAQPQQQARPQEQARPAPAPGELAEQDGVERDDDGDREPAGDAGAPARWRSCPLRPIRVRLVSRSSGISAKGSAKLRTTCERTRMRSGSRPVAMMAMAGMMVMKRRRKMGNLMSRKPSMMTCPAMTPTVEDDRPEQSSATAKTIAAARPKSGPRVWYASSMVGWRLVVWTKATAAIRIMAELMSQAPFMATKTSMSS